MRKSLNILFLLFVYNVSLYGQVKSKHDTLNSLNLGFYKKYVIIVKDTLGFDSILVTDKYILGSVKPKKNDVGNGKRKMECYTNGKLLSIKRFKQSSSYFSAFAGDIDGFRVGWEKYGKWLYWRADGKKDKIEKYCKKKIQGKPKLIKEYIWGTDYKVYYIVKTKISIK
jgi:hypothetical protein